MKRIMAVSLVVISLFTFCGRRFGVGDRFEGVKQDTLRVYVRISNTEAYDGQAGEVKLKAEFQQKGKERAGLIAAANPDIVVRGFGGTGSGEGKIVFMECGDDYCEAFLDYMLGSRGAEEPVKKTEEGR